MTDRTTTWTVPQIWAGRVAILVAFFLAWEQVAARKVNGQTCRQIAGAWVDESFDAKMKVVKVKALSKAYFRLLEKQPALKEVFQLGTRLVWVAPSGVALVIEPSGGKETMTDTEIAKLFTKK